MDQIVASLNYAFRGVASYAQAAGRLAMSFLTQGPPQPSRVPDPPQQTPPTPLHVQASADPQPARISIAPDSKADSRLRHRDSSDPAPELGDISRLGEDVRRLLAQKTLDVHARQEVAQRETLEPPVHDSDEVMILARLLGQLEGWRDASPQLRTFVAEGLVHRLEISEEQAILPPSKHPLMQKAMEIALRAEELSLDGARDLIASNLLVPPLEDAEGTQRPRPGTEDLARIVVAAADNVASSYNTEINQLPLTPDEARHPRETKSHSAAVTPQSATLHAATDMETALDALPHTLVGAEGHYLTVTGMLMTLYEKSPAPFELIFMHPAVARNLASIIFDPAVQKQLNLTSEQHRAANAGFAPGMQLLLNNVARYEKCLASGLAETPDWDAIPIWAVVGFIEQQQAQPIDSKHGPVPDTLDTHDAEDDGEPASVESSDEPARSIPAQSTPVPRNTLKPPHEPRTDSAREPGDLPPGVRPLNEKGGRGVTTGRRPQRHTSHHDISKNRSVPRKLQLLAGAKGKKWQSRLARAASKALQKARNQKAAQSTRFGLPRQY